ncbi:hypothetical protein [Streptomyces sp.]|uniref:hypothetical protein n=1 Tax=Streptomyces sp. TaxID=1931 RepID=UPI002F927B69
MRAHTFKESAIARDQEGKFARKGSSGGNAPAISTALRDAAGPDAVQDSPSRHSTGRGMPSIVAGADIRTRDGKEIALDRHSDGTSTIGVGDTTITVPNHAASNVSRRLQDLTSEDADVGTQHWVKDHATGPDGLPKTSIVALVRKEGPNAYSLRLAGPDASADAVLNAPPVTLAGRDIDNLDNALDRLNSSSRVDTGNGDLDTYTTDDHKFGFRHLGEDGTPVQAEFTPQSFARIRRAMNVVIDGFDDDDPDGPDEGVTHVDVDTNLGKVRVELNGEWQQDGPGNNLIISPAGGDGWGIVVDGDRQRAFSEALEDLEAAGEAGEFYDLSMGYRR